MVLISVEIMRKSICVSVRTEIWVYLVWSGLRTLLAGGASSSQSFMIYESLSFSPRPVSHLFACSSVSCPMPVITASNGEFNFRFRCKPTGLESPTSMLDLWAHNDIQIFANGVRNTVIFIKLILDLAHFSLRDCCLYSKPSPLSSPEYVCITAKRSINLSENHIWCSTALGWLWLNLSPK
jgi:hypothetical protein